MPNGTPMAWMASDNDQPIYVDHGEGAGFTDVDGFTYVDFNASDLAMFCGHAVPAIVRAVDGTCGALHPVPAADRGLDRGRRRARTPVPAPDPLAVHPVGDAGEHRGDPPRARRHRPRGRRAVRGALPRPLRGRARRSRRAAASTRCSAVCRRASRGRVRIAQFNDAGLAGRGVGARRCRAGAHRAGDDQRHPLPRAVDGWHDALAPADPRARHRSSRIDETHTHVVGEGGATGLFGLEPDIVTIGKAVAGGIPMGAYGVDAGARGRARRRAERRDGRHAVREPAVGCGRARRRSPRC